MRSEAFFHRKAGIQVPEWCPWCDRGVLIECECGEVICSRCDRVEHRDCGDPEERELRRAELAEEFPLEDD